MVNVVVVHDQKRGCGWRKAGGLYLRADGAAASCGKLPLPLCKCPTCGAGIKFARSWTWVDAKALGSTAVCKEQSQSCAVCPLGGVIERAGLLWIGEKFYKTPGDFTSEARDQGISRRLPQVPKDFKVGVTWVLVAHRKTIVRPCDDCSNKEPCDNCPPCAACGGAGVLYTPAIFAAFKPSRIEYVVKEGDTEEKLERLVKRGITPVRIVRVEKDTPMLPGMPVGTDGGL